MSSPVTPASGGLEVGDEVFVQGKGIGIVEKLDERGAVVRMDSECLACGSPVVEHDWHPYEVLSLTPSCLRRRGLWDDEGAT